MIYIYYFCFNLCELIIQYLLSSLFAIALIVILSYIYQVIQADEENRKLIFSEKEAVWSKVSNRVNVGDIFAGRVGSAEDYGAFIHLRFPDGISNL